MLHLPVLASYFNVEPTVRNEVNAILGRLSANILDKLTVLRITDGDTRDVNMDVRSKFSIVIKTNRTRDSLEILKLLLTNYNLLKRNPHVYLAVINESYLGSMNTREDLTPLMSKQIKELRLDDPSTRIQCTLFASGEFPFCPQFTHFTAEYFHIDPSVPSAFLKAVKEGKLPNLRRIELNHCELYDFEWPEAPEFSLTTFEFDTSEIQKPVSNLTELTLDRFSEIDHRISTQLTKLSVLKLTVASEHCLLQFNDGLRQGPLPRLTELSVNASGNKHRTKLERFLDKFDLEQVEKLKTLSLQRFIISSRELNLLCQKLPYLQLRGLNLSNSHSMTGSLSVLFTHSFPRLNTLKLKSSHLSSEDLRALCEADVEGKLPQLKQLDISGSQMSGISDLFTHSTQWNQLTTLGTADLRVLNIEPEFLTSLEELILESASSKAITVTRSWPHLQKLKLDVNRSEIYRHVIDGVDRGLFPALEIIRYSGHDISSSDLFKLYKANISVEKIEKPYI